MDITATPIIRPRQPIPDFTATPIIRFPVPIPGITVTPFIRPRPRIPDNTASPPLPFRPLPPNTASTAANQTLNVSPSPPINVGEAVLFEVVLRQPPPPGWHLQYRFDFGDGSSTDWSPERHATHTYQSPGNGNYPVHVEILTTNRNGAQSSKSIDKNVDVIPPSNPTPSATETTSPSITPSPTPITPSPTPITPTPTSSYTPTVTVAPTAIPSITPISPPPPLWPPKMLWLYIAVGLGVAALASLGYLKLRPVMAGPLTFVGHADWDAPQAAPQNLNINYGLYFHSNRSAGEYRLETDGASSILRKKK
jgi:hypothetical protein